MIFKKRIHNSKRLSVCGASASKHREYMPAKHNKMAANLTVDLLLKVSVFIDVVRDTSDTEWYSDEEGRDVEYEPETETEGEERGPISEDSSGQTDVS